MAKSDINMLEGSIWDKRLQFAIPLAITRIMQQLFNAADVAIVGQFVGKQALAAVGANAVVINLMLNLFIGLSIGTNVVCANYLGAREYLNLKRGVHTSIIIAVAGGAFLAVFGAIFARDILVYIDTPAEVLDMAIIYLQILMIGVPILMIYNFGSAILRSKGDTKRPLYAMVAAGIVNVLLNLFFVLELGMSVDGVALATVLSSVVSAAMILYYLVNESGPLQLRWQKLSFDWNVFMAISRVGVPAGIQGMVFSFSNVIIQIALNNLGHEYVAATAVALNYEFAAFFILAAFAQAGTTFVGQNYGARNILRCRQIVKWTIWLNLAVAGTASILFSVFAEPLSAIFTADPQVISYSVTRIRYILTFEFISIFMESFSGAMRGVNYSFYPALACMIGVCVFRIIYIYTVFAAEPTFENLMIVYPVSWVLTTIVITAMYFYVFNKLERNYASV